jgi:hypothetical protein
MDNIGIRVTGTGDVGPASVGGTVRSITLTAADAVDGTVVIRDGGSGGTVRLTLKTPLKTTFQWIGELTYVGQLHATVTGAGVEVVVEL